MKKFIFLLLALAGVFCVAFAVAGCSGDGHTHNYGELIPEEPATCAEEGMRAHYFCADCGKYFDADKKETSEADLKIAVVSTHVYGELIGETAASCDVNGMKQHYECSVCGKYFDADRNEKQADELSIPAKGHTFGELVPQRSPSCESNGMNDYYRCKECGKYFDKLKNKSSYDELSIPAKGHTYGELIPEEPATCKDEGMLAHYFCADCGKYFDSEQVETDEADLKTDIDLNSHIWQVNQGESNKKSCTICGASESIYNLSEDNTKISLGEYPQSEVKESGLKTTLGWVAGNGVLPTEDDAHGWTDYNYYVSGKVKSFMWYRDVVYQNNRYRGIYFTEYRDTSHTSSILQYENGYEVKNVYWFKFEPLEWRILKQENGKALLLSEYIIDGQKYYRSEETRTLNGKTVYSSNYKESDIRQWLNETFLTTAFDTATRDIIEVTEVDNSKTSFRSTSDEPYACENTNDKVFLLSYNEFDEYFGDGDFISYSKLHLKQLENTEYALSQGLDNNLFLHGIAKPYWWLRSPSSDIGALQVRYPYEKMSITDYVGQPTFKAWGIVVSYSCYGVVPAIWIKL